MLKVIVTGSRNFNDYDLLKATLDEKLGHVKFYEIVSGTASGADKLGEEYAAEKSLSVKKIPADWKRFGRLAGYLRNKQMAEYADMAFIFFDGKSKGALLMIDLAKENDLKTEVIMYEPM